MVVDDRGGYVRQVCCFVDALEPRTRGLTLTFITGTERSAIAYKAVTDDGVGACAIHALINGARIQIIATLRLVVAPTIETNFHGAGVVVHARNALTSQTNNVADVGWNETFGGDCCDRRRT